MLRAVAEPRGPSVPNKSGTCSAGGLAAGDRTGAKTLLYWSAQGLAPYRTPAARPPALPPAMNGAGKYECLRQPSKVVADFGQTGGAQPCKHSVN